MASWGGTRQLVSGSGSWDFPAIDDQSPRESQESEPERFPRHYRIAMGAVLGLVVVAVAIAALGVMVQQRSVTTEILTTDPPAEQLAPPVEEIVIVHVSGAVHRPGLVELGSQARVFDAVESAGGATALADVNRLNLARPVMDGEHIVVPELGQEGQGAESASDTEPISLSRSSLERLQDLPGVGPAIAERIVAWRNDNGAFRSVDDALAVPGIGPATLERFRDQVVP